MFWEKATAPVGGALLLTHLYLVYSAARQLSLTGRELADGHGAVPRAAHDAARRGDGVPRGTSAADVGHAAVAISGFARKATLDVRRRRDGVGYAADSDATHKKQPGARNGAREKRSINYASSEGRRRRLVASREVARRRR